MVVELGSYVAWDHCPELNQTKRRDDGPILQSETTVCGYAGT